MGFARWNSEKGYGWVAVLLHWIVAVGFITLYFLGEAYEHAKADNLPREEVLAAIRLHISFGAVFFLFFAVRVVSHFKQKKPEALGGPAPLNLLAKIIQWSFLAVIVAQIITGPLAVWSGGRDIGVFDWFSIPTPFDGKIEWLHELCEVIHVFAPSLFWPLLILHVAGALKHLVIDRDGTVKRMIIPRSE